MKRLLHAAALAALCASAVAMTPRLGAAQEEGGAPPKVDDAKLLAQAKVWNARPAPTDPRDFTGGAWWTRGYDFKYRQLDGSLPPMTDSEAKNREHRLAMAAAGTPLPDASTQCKPHGIPRLIASPYPIQFDYEPNMIVILHETAHNVRFIHMDGKPVPADTPRSFLGYSVGHWEDDTLVIHTDHFNDQTQVDEEGLSHGLKLQVTERIRKFTNKYGGVELENKFTVDDPDHYTRPWTGVRLFPWRSDVKVNEYSCEENNRNAVVNGQVVAK